MTIDPIIQATFERNLAWKALWPRGLFTFSAIFQILIGLVIFVTELFNILMDFWHTNIFGGIWCSILIFINWILLFVTVCCTTTVRSSTCAFIWNVITLVGLTILIIFDIIFILNPYTCVLTPTCSTQPQVISLNFIMQTISKFENYSSYDSKKFLLQIQVGCAGTAFLMSLTNIVIYIICRMKMRKRVFQDRSTPVVAINLPRPQSTIVKEMKTPNSR